jgi:hypothetical protein
MPASSSGRHAPQTTVRFTRTIAQLLQAQRPNPRSWSGGFMLKTERLTAA